MAQNSFTVSRIYLRDVGGSDNVSKMSSAKRLISIYGWILQNRFGHYEFRSNFIDAHIFLSELRSEIGRYPLHCKGSLSGLSRAVIREKCVESGR